MIINIKNGFIIKNKYDKTKGLDHRNIDLNLLSYM